MWSLYDYVIAVSNYMSYVDEWWMDESSTEEPPNLFPFDSWRWLRSWTGNVSERVQRLVILNKALNGFWIPIRKPRSKYRQADLVTPNVGLAMRTCRSCRIFCFCIDSCARSHLPTSRWRNLIEEAGQPCLCPGEEDLKCGCFLTSVLLAFPYGLSCSARLTTASENRNLVKIKDFALEHARAKHPRTLGPLANCIGWIWMAFPPFDHFADLKNRGLMLMVVGLPNATGLTDDADANKQWQIQMQIQTTNTWRKHTFFSENFTTNPNSWGWQVPPSLVAWRRLASVQQDTGVTVSRSHWNTNCRVEKEIKKTSAMRLPEVFADLFSAQYLTKAKICPQLLWAVLCVFLECLPC